MRTLTSSLSIGLSVLAYSGAVLAQGECATDADCGEGMVCEVVGSGGCDGAAPCPPDSPDCMMAPVECTSEEFRACVAAPCETDADCGADMVCATYEWEACDGVAAADCDGEGCEPVEMTEPTCESGSTKECAYRWTQPCAADADCGDGFTCVTEESCACSGGGSMGSMGGEAPPADAALPIMALDGGAPPPPPEPPVDDCTCSEYTYCSANEVECETSDECPSGWTCEMPVSTCGGEEQRPAPVAMDEPPSMASGSADAGADDAADIAPPDGMQEFPPCEPVTGPGQCVPPGGGFEPPRGGDDQGTPTAGGDPVPEEDGAGTPDENGMEPGEVDVDDPELGDDDVDQPTGDDDTEEAGDDDVAEEDDEPAASDDDEAAEDEDDEPALESSDDTDSGDSGSCSVASHSTSTNSGALVALAGLLGLAFFRRRK